MYHNVFARLIYVADSFDAAGLSIFADDIDILICRLANASWEERRQRFHMPTDDVEFTEYLKNEFGDSNTLPPQKGQKFSHAQRSRHMVDNATGDDYEISDIADAAKQMYTTILTKATQFLNQYERLRDEVKEDGPEDIKKLCDSKIPYYKTTINELEAHVPRLKTLPSLLDKFKKTNKENEKFAIKRAIQDILIRIHNHKNNIIMAGEKIAKTSPVRHDRGVEVRLDESGKPISPSSKVAPTYRSDQPIR